MAKKKHEYKELLQSVCVDLMKEIIGYLPEKSDTWKNICFILKNSNSSLERTIFNNIKAIDNLAKINKEEAKLLIIATIKMFDQLDKLVSEKKVSIDNDFKNAMTNNLLQLAIDFGIKNSYRSDIGIGNFSTSLEKAWHEIKKIPTFEKQKQTPISSQVVKNIIEILNSNQLIMMLAQDRQRLLTSIEKWSNNETAKKNMEVIDKLLSISLEELNEAKIYFEKEGRNNFKNACETLIALKTLRGKNTQDMEQKEIPIAAAFLENEEKPDPKEEMIKASPQNSTNSNNSELIQTAEIITQELESIKNSQYRELSSSSGNAMTSDYLRKKEETKKGEEKEATNTFKKKDCP